MIPVAIVEDSAEERARIRACLSYVESTTDAAFDVHEFPNGLEFLGSIDGPVPFDLVFMDIDMPGMNGMETARALRTADSAVLLIFVTNMAQYAVRGYDVNAAGFILKPVSYYDFLMRMRKCIGILQTRVEEYVTLNMRQGIIRLPARDILYVEVNRHMLTYHTFKGTVQTTGSLAETEASLRGSGFLRCNSCYLVNPKAIQAVLGYDIRLINGETIQISHPKKKQFMQDLNIWLGEGKNL